MVSAEALRLRRRQRWAAHLFTLSVIAAWALYARSMPIYLFPGPLDVAARMGDFLSQAYLAAQLGRTLLHVVGALGCAFLLGCAVALTAHYLPVTRVLVNLHVTPFMNAFSGIGWTFLALVWFGINSFTVIFAVTMILVPFVVINLRAGLDNLDDELIEMARSCTRSGLRVFLRIVLPLLVPFMFASLRIAFGVAWKVALTAELFGGNAGVGYLLNVARQEFDTPTIFAVIAFIILFVYAAYALLLDPLQARLQRRYGRG